MISLSFDDRINLLDLEKKVTISEDRVVLKETNYSGLANLDCVLNGYSIVFHNSDKNVLGYLKDEKCADAIIFQKRQNKWYLNIVEFKKTINVNSLRHSMQQFKGAVINSLAAAGILDIHEFDDICFYSAYREDKISEQRNENPVLFKYPDNIRLVKQWDGSFISFDFLDKVSSYKKIPLDENGNGKAII